MAKHNKKPNFNADLLYKIIDIILRTVTIILAILTYLYK